MFGALAMTTFLTMLALAVVWASLGVHGLLLGRMPGEWLQRRVHHPRLWGVGALLMVGSWSAGSPSLLVIGMGLVTLGHIAKLTR